MSTLPTTPPVSFTNPERAAQIYHLLIAAARNRQILTYKLLAETTGAFPANLGHLLGFLMRWCQNHNLPPLTVIVVQSHTGKPGEGLLTSTDHDADRERVFNHPWYSIKPPLPDELAAV